jgi:tetratricopeptide (TPR) repeat protein
MQRIVGVLSVLALVNSARAQPPPAHSNAPLAQLRGEPDLQRALAAITPDRAVQGLIAEGVRQLAAGAPEQALANLLAAYARVPSPKLLVNIAAILRDLGRLADAANTYQRYLADPATSGERGEVKELLLRLDEQLCVLTVHVAPHGSEVSLDGGPFVAVGETLTTRVRPGIHLARIRNGEQAAELTINAFAGEAKDAQLAVRDAPEREGPAHVDAWLDDSTRYSAGPGRARAVIANGRALAAIAPRDDAAEASGAVVASAAPAIGSGALVVARIDGRGRGFAGGVGLAIARTHFEGEAIALLSAQLGGYLGVRYRLWLARWRPYAAVGLPVFAFDQMDATQIAIGLRAAAGLEIGVHRHLSIQADLGYEHFFALGDAKFYADYFVPTLGVIGRL